ncbi:MAG: alpha/beta fold hydrolase [Vibrio sp.]
MLKERHFQLPHIRLAALEVEHQNTTDFHAENGQVNHEEVTLLFLHGWLDNAASFHSVLEHLSQMPETQHWRMLALDFPGHGLSDRRDKNDFYAFHDYIADLHYLLNQICAKNLILVGHSLGALVASCYSAAFPENVRGLVQIEGLGPLSDDSANTVSRLRKGILSRQRILAKPLRRYESQRDACLHRMEANKLTAKQLKPMIERGTVEQDGFWYWRYDPKLRCESPYRMTEEQALTYLEAVECPNLLILGDKGFPQLAQATERKQALNTQNTDNKQNEQVTVSGGHHCHIQSPEAVSQLLVKFTQSIF